MMVAIDFHYMERKYYGSQWLPSTVWLQAFFKLYFVCVCVQKKKDNYKWNNMRVMTECSFFGELSL